MIKINNLKFAYKDKNVIKDINIKFELGKIYCIVGENGAGKTTLIELILRLKRIQQGEIFFENQKDLDEITLRQLGVVFQENSLRPRLKVKEEIDAYVDLYKVDKAWVDKIIETFKLFPIFNKIGNSLSGGERRRVLLALAFLNKPKYVVLDEPFTGIDTKLRHEFRVFLDTYVKEHKSLILFSEHNILECQKYNYHFIFMYDGEFILSGEHKTIHEKLKKMSFEYKDLQDLYLEIWKGGKLIENLIKK
ncbi:ATP-binding cassette domain-containing protein [Mammaliicoccus lentus]|uniref:ATP-binding cassette domain-containing protein n=1 Tax=Mammaliicoccus lentus TaxID=42858 RepID=UPI001B31AE3B|nr:ABC transporter ATP-binding protein [Mammaliicoccus lentus]